MLNYNVVQNLIQGFNDSYDISYQLQQLTKIYNSNSKFDPKLLQINDSQLKELINQFVDSCNIDKENYQLTHEQQYILQILYDICPKDQQNNSRLHEFIDNENISLKLIDNNNQSLKFSKFNISENITEVNIKDIFKLLELGININIKDAQGKTILHKAASQGNIELISYLINLYADVNIQDQQGNAPLHDFSKRGHYEISNKIAHNAEKISSDNNSFSPEEKKIYLEHKAQIISRNILNVDNITRLNRANISVNSLISKIAQSESQIIDILCNAGAEGNVQNYMGDTPLHNAVQKRNIYIANRLIANNANINIKNINGKTVLHQAARNGDTSLVKEFIMLGADINALSDSNDTALHMAALSGKISTINELITSQANLNIKNSSGETALDYSIDALKKPELYNIDKNDAKQSIDILLEAGAAKTFKYYHNYKAHNYISAYLKSKFYSKNYEFELPRVILFMASVLVAAITTISPMMFVLALALENIAVNKFINKFWDNDVNAKINEEYDKSLLSKIKDTTWKTTFPGYIWKLEQQSKNQNPNDRAK